MDNINMKFINILQYLTIVTKYKYRLSGQGYAFQKREMRNIDAVQQEMENKINWMKENSSRNWTEKRNKRKQKQSIKQNEGIVGN